MNFIVRAVKHEDVSSLLDLAKQFTLLNLPGDRKTLSEKIDRSEASFAGNLAKEKSEYLFVIEDLDEKTIVASSLILAKHGTYEIPHSFFQVIRRDHFSDTLGIGFIHQVLRFQMDVNGPSEIGGLLVDRNYRRHPDKLGKQISFIRFLYMALYPEKFEDRVLCELTPPLTDEGRSEFWEALGRRFTGLNYQEADMLSQTHKEFIESLFPEDDIYLCLLDPKARSVLGRVGDATKPAQHLLESIGFKYLDEVDPFDGGPHYGADIKDISVIQQAQKFKIADFKDCSFQKRFLLGTTGDIFQGALVAGDQRGHEIALPPKIKDQLELSNGDEVIITPFSFGGRKE